MPGRILTFGTIAFFGALGWMLWEVHDLSAQVSGRY